VTVERANKGWNSLYLIKNSKSRKSFRKQKVCRIPCGRHQSANLLSTRSSNANVYSMTKIAIPEHSKIKTMEIRYESSQKRFPVPEHIKDDSKHQDATFMAGGL
jgi:hypothetical protein